MENFSYIIFHFSFFIEDLRRGRLLLPPASASCRLPPAAASCFLLLDSVKPNAEFIINRD